MGWYRGLQLSLFKAESTGSKSTSEKMELIDLEMENQDLARKERKALLDTLHPETMGTFDTNDMHRSFWGEQLPVEVIRYGITRRSFTLLNDLAFYVRDHGNFTGETYGDYEPLTYLLGLQSGHRRVPENTVHFKPYSKSDANEREAQYAFITTARTLNQKHVQVCNDHDGLVSRKLYGDLARFLLEHYKEASQIVQIINERDIEPVGEGLDAIKGLLEAKQEVAPVLSQGAL